MQAVPTPKPRHIAGVVAKAARQSPVIVITGPRQSGKTTLARRQFPDRPYLSLEDPDVRQRAASNPREFLAACPEGAIFDEAQRLPDLFSYLQTEVDRDPRPGRFDLTGSENLARSQRVSQSLAGRALLLKLLPFSHAELLDRTAAPPGHWDEPPGPATQPVTTRSWTATAFRGFFPRAVLEDADPTLWLDSNLETYVERDVRQIANIGDLDSFPRFLRLVAARFGQLLNDSNLAMDASVSVTTARAWISVLEAGFITRLLPPFHENFNKRLVKTPKLHLVDPGLMCRLLAIRSPEEVALHPLRGAIFETLVVGELIKAFLNAGEDPPLFFWRDRSGHEVDVIVDMGIRRIPIEIKATEIVRDDDTSPVRRWMRIAKASRTGVVIHSGDVTSPQEDGMVLRSWRDLT